MIKLLVLGAVLAAGLSACGGPTASTTGSGGSSAASSGAVLAPAHTTLGTVLVDHAGRTVYLLTADSPGHSTCSAQCLAYWPSVAPGSSTKPPPGVTAPVGTAKVAGGGSTVTVGGWPVYTFVQDSSPGDVTGEGVKSFGGVWYAVSPSGHAVEPGASSTPAPSTSSGRGGY
jgi:predicted lipoprotein with Yx(FWY)xxD motif